MCAAVLRRGPFCPSAKVVTRACSVLPRSLVFPSWRGVVMLLRSAARCGAAASRRSRCLPSAPFVRFEWLPTANAAPSARMQQRCSSSAGARESAKGKALTDAEIEVMKRAISDKVGKTTARDWMPAFVFDFVAECMLEAAVRKVHIERGCEEDDPVYGGDIEVIPEDQWAPRKVCIDLPFRRGGFRKDMDAFFEVCKGELNYTNERLWALHLGTPERKFVEIARVGALPLCVQPPSAWEGPEQARLLIDPDDRGVPKVFIQLAPEVPPMLFLPVRPRPYAVQRVMRSLKQRMVAHAHAARHFWEERMEAGEKLMTEASDFHDATGKPALDDPEQWERVMNLSGVMAPLPNGEYIPGAPEASTTLYLGPWACGDALFEDMHSVNPFLHAWPAYRSWASGGMLAETVARRFQPGSEHSSVHKSVWVTKYSKTVLVFHHRMDMSFSNQMAWAEGCAHSSKTLDRGVLATQKEFQFPSFDRVRPHPDVARFQQFVTIYYEPSQLLSGGGQVVKRMNAACRMEFPEDMPVDVAAALMFWRNKGHDLLWHDMEQKEIVTRGLPILDHMELATDLKHPWALYANAIAKLGVVKHPRLTALIDNLMDHSSPAVRWAVAKAAQLIHRQDILRLMWVRDRNPVLATAINYLTNSFMGKMLGKRSVAAQREDAVADWLQFAPNATMPDCPLIATPEPKQFAVHYTLKDDAERPKLPSDKGALPIASSYKKARERRARGLSAMLRASATPEGVLRGDTYVAGGPQRHPLKV